MAATPLYDERNAAELLACEDRPRDVEAWPLVPGARVRCHPRPLVAGGKASRDWFGVVVAVYRSDRHGWVARVRDERGIVHDVLPGRLRVRRA